MLARVALLLLVMFAASTMSLQATVLCGAGCALLFATHHIVMGRGFTGHAMLSMVGLQCGIVVLAVLSFRIHQTTSDMIAIAGFPLTLAVVTLGSAASVWAARTMRQWQRWQHQYTTLLAAFLYPCCVSFIALVGATTR